MCHNSNRIFLQGPGAERKIEEAIVDLLLLDQFVFCEGVVSVFSLCRDNGIFVSAYHMISVVCCTMLDYWQITQTVIALYLAFEFFNLPWHNTVGVGIN